MKIERIAVGRYRITGIVPGEPISNKRKVKVKPAYCREVSCPACNGEGKVAGHTCGSCIGTGKVKIKRGRGL